MSLSTRRKSAWDAVFAEWRAVRRQRAAVVRRLVNLHRIVVPVTGRRVDAGYVRHIEPLADWWPRREIKACEDRYGTEDGLAAFLSERWSHVAAYPRDNPGLEVTARCLAKYVDEGSDELIAKLLLAAVLQDPSWTRKIGPRASVMARNMFTAAHETWNAPWHGNTKYRLPGVYGWDSRPVRTRLDLMGQVFDVLDKVGRSHVVVVISPRPVAAGEVPRPVAPPGTQPRTDEAVVASLREALARGPGGVGGRLA